MMPKKDCKDNSEAVNRSNPPLFPSVVQPSSTFILRADPGVEPAHLAKSTSSAQVGVWVDCLVYG